MRPCILNALSLYVGLDLGTSGARISVLDSSTAEIYSKSLPWDQYDNPKIWLRTVSTLFHNATSFVPQLQSQCVSLCFSGTSASCLLVESKTLKVIEQPRMYDYHVVKTPPSPTAGQQALDWITAPQHGIPPQHTVTSPTSTLAKLLSWQAHTPRNPYSTRLVHQADYLSHHAMYHGTFACGKARWPVQISSDWHNCLKLGYNVRKTGDVSSASVVSAPSEADTWPIWMKSLLESVGLSLDILPSRIVSPGQPIGIISPVIAQQWNIPNSTVIVAGSTDSNAAFIAATGLQPNVRTAVTSLGSTLVLKQLSTVYVENAELGVYSHAFPTTLRYPAVSNDNDDDDDDIVQPKLWLVGGASNVGCAVLRAQGFSNFELSESSQNIDPREDSPLQYYPLVQPGERFPVADSTKAPLLEPVPNSRGEFLKGILQGIASVEVQGYQTLQTLGARPLSVVLTSGGGSVNDSWRQMRQRMLQAAFSDDSPLIVDRAVHSEASYGAALLAASTFVTDA